MKGLKSKTNPIINAIVSDVEQISFSIPGILFFNFQDYKFLTLFFEQKYLKHTDNTISIPIMI